MSCASRGFITSGFTASPYGYKLVGFGLFLIY
jgi:hypothetical protein